MIESPQEVAMVEQFIKLFQAGNRVVIGLLRNVQDGELMARKSGVEIRVKCRSTREDFLFSRPAELRKDDSLKAPFYYELEMIEMQGTQGKH